MKEKTDAGSFLVHFAPKRNEELLKQAGGIGEMNEVCFPISEGKFPLPVEVNGVPPGRGLVIVDRVSQAKRSKGRGEMWALSCVRARACVKECRPQRLGLREARSVKPPSASNFLAMCFLQFAPLQAATVSKTCVCVEGWEESFAVSGLERPKSTVRRRLKE